MEEHERHLTNRDRQILRFVGRYRAATTPMIRRKFFPNSSLENAARVVRRLERRELLEVVECGPELSYVLPTRRGLEVAGLEPRSSRPLTEQSLPVVLSVTSYCVDRSLRRLTNSEFCELYPELTKPGLRSSNYVLVESEAGPKLQLLVVDRGGTARRIQGRVRRMIAQRIGLPAFRSLMDAGRFEINVLVGTDEQNKKIKDRIKRHSFGNVQVTTTLVRELGDILLIGE